MSSNSQRSVVITGIGVFSPLGIGVENFWQNLSQGKSGIQRITHMEATALPHDAGGEIADFSEDLVKDLFDPSRPVKKMAKVMCREIQFGVGSAFLAVQNSGLEFYGKKDKENDGLILEHIERSRLGVEFGANLMLSPPEVLKNACWNCVDEEQQFHHERWGTDGKSKMEPLWLLKYLPNMPGCHIGIGLDARGPNNSLTLDEASANIVLGEAFRIITRDTADMMFAGTTGTRIHTVKAIHAHLWDQLATGDGDPATFCKPFDLNRNGQVVAEGAATFVLEEEETAKKRGARILARILGTGSSCVNDGHGKGNRKQALVNSMRSALRDAGLQPADIGHINAHGTGETTSDAEEAAAIHEVFGDLGNQVPVTALKSYLGNSGSGCGSVELAGSILSLNNGVILPTLNYSTPDPACNLNVVHGELLEATNKTVMKLNVTRMGQGCALIAQIP